MLACRKQILAMIIIWEQCKEILTQQQYKWLLSSRKSNRKGYAWYSLPFSFCDKMFFWSPSILYLQIFDHSFSVFFVGSPSPIYPLKVTPQDSIFSPFLFSLYSYFPLSSSSLMFLTIVFRLTHKSIVLVQISSRSHIHLSVDI